MIVAAVALGVAGVGSILAFLLVGSVSESGPETASGPQDLRYSPDFTLEDAQEFGLFSLYWLGQSFEGLPLTGVTKIEKPGSSGLEEETLANIVRFDYGDCVIPPGAEACAIPLTVSIRPYCEVPPEIIAEEVKTGPSITIREAQVQWTGSSPRLWTSDVSLGIFGSNTELVNAAAHNLVGLTPGGPLTAEGPLGPPLPFNCPPKPHFRP